MKFSALSLFAASALTLASFALSGCATGIIAPPSSVAIPAIEGHVGPTSPNAGQYDATCRCVREVTSTPVNIYGANIVLWQTYTPTSGYPSASNEPTAGSTIIAGSISGKGAITTSSTGGFSISSYSNSYSCTPGTYLYITATGGSLNGIAPGTAGALVNNNIVQIAALGPCGNFGATPAGNSTVHVAINEATTVAAAYALGNFTYVDNSGTAGLQAVYIGAPAGNNATTGTGTCTVNTTTGQTTTNQTTSCTSAGLAHAFQNALDLVDSVDTGTSATGYPRSALPNNANSSIPVALIDTLASILQACTNSAGGAAGDSPATICGYLFTDATPPYVTSGTGVAPTDELTAMINVAKYPTNNVGNPNAASTSPCSGAAGGLYCLLGSSSASFLPVLTAAPHDWSIAIVFTGLNEPQSLALDPNDNVYVVANDTTNTLTGDVYAFKPDGTQSWTVNNTNLCYPGQVATDTVGNVWISDYGSSSSTCIGNTTAVYGYAQTNGTLNYTLNAANNKLMTNVFGLAVDLHNNLWVGSKSSSCGTSGTGCVAEIPFTPTAGATAASYGNQTNLLTYSAKTFYDADVIELDAAQNVWAGAYEAGSSGAWIPMVVLPNTGSASAPTYGSYSTAATYAEESYGMVAIDSTGNVWTSASNSSPGPYYALSYKLSGTSISSPANVYGGTTTSTQTNGTTNYFVPGKAIQGEFDGSNRLWFANDSTSGQIYYYIPANNTGAYPAAYNASTGVPGVYSLLIPCYLASGAATCPTASTAQSPRALQIDSAGSIWVAFPNNGYATYQGSAAGYLEEIIGTAAPTWPQLSYAKFGVSPQ